MQVDIDRINPYIRRARHFTLKAPFSLNDKIIFDYALIYVGGGECDIITNKGYRRVKENDIMIIPPGVRFRMDCVGENDYEQIMILFDMEFDNYSGQRYSNFNRVWEEMDDDERAMVGKNIFGNDDIEIFDTKNPSHIVDIMFEIIVNYQENTPIGRLRSKGLLCEILSELFSDKIECVAKDPSVVMYSAQRHKITERVKDYIEANYSRNISLEQICDVFYINKYTLLRQFKKDYGMPVIQYVNYLKLKYAKAMIRQDKLTIREISEAVGFDSVYSFSRFFKTHTGISPTVYQDRQRAKEKKHG